MLRSSWRVEPVRSKGISLAPQVLLKRFHKDYDAKKEEQTLELTDGRVVGFAEYGSFGGSSIPAFFFHGCPGSRYDGAALIESAKKFNLHLICPDRPGFGLSTAQSGRKLSDYPEDIHMLAQSLGFPRYHIFGLSGGGPYAVACARYLSMEELLSVSVIASAGPPETLTFGNIGWWGLMMSYFARYAPSSLCLFMDFVTARDPSFHKAVTQGLDRQSEDDKIELSDPRVQAMTMAAFQAAYTQGSTGVVQDIQTVDNEWGFQLKDIENKINLFYGQNDVHAPLSFGKHYQEHLPSAELIELENASHVTILRRVDDIFQHVLSEPGSISKT